MWVSDDTITTGASDSGIASPTSAPNPRPPISRPLRTLHGLHYAPEPWVLMADGSGSLDWLADAGLEPQVYEHLAVLEEQLWAVPSRRRCSS